MSVTRTRLKYVASLNDDVLPEVTDPGRTLRYIDISNVDSTGQIHDGETMAFEDAPSRARRLVRDGDVIVSTVRTYLRAIAPVSQPDPELVVSTGFAVVRPRSELDSHFASYALQDSTFVDQVVAHSEGVSYPAINPSELRCLTVPLPPLPAQRSIATYLDSETFRIDSLIDRKQRFIELLLEKRTALITRAVTKGLDPDVEIKDSGIEWLGEIPAHWDVLRIKRAARIRYGLAEPPPELPDGPPMLRATNVFTGRISEVDMKHVDPAAVPKGRNAWLSAGEIIVVRSGACTGDSAIVPDEYDGAVAGFDMVVSAMNSDPNYLAWVLLSQPSVEAQIEPARMRAAQPHLNAEELGDVVFACPPSAEQAVVAAHISEQTENIAVLISKTEASIRLLKEYRTALISAAVTGQIEIPAADSGEDVA